MNPNVPNEIPKPALPWIDVTDQYTAAAKEQYEERQWEALAQTFSTWAWGKQVPSEVSELKKFFMRFADEIASHRYNHPTKK